MARVYFLTFSNLVPRGRPEPLLTVRSATTRCPTYPSPPVRRAARTAVIQPLSRRRGSPAAGRGCHRQEQALARVRQTRLQASGYRLVLTWELLAVPAIALLWMAAEALRPAASLAGPPTWEAAN